MMRLGIVGTDRQVEGVAAAAAARGDSLVRLSDDSEPGAWEHFLDAASCDAVIIGGEGRAEAVRTLVQVGRPLVLAQPISLSMLWAWEIEMIRQDVGGPIVPILPARLHPFMTRLRRAVEGAMAGSGALGILETVEFDRRLPDRRREPVLESLARDADLVRVLVGEPEKLAAFGVAADAATWTSLTVGFSGQSLIPVRWQVAAGTEGSLRITLRGSSGAVSVEAPDDWSQPWTWSVGDGHTAEAVSFEHGSAILGVLDRILGHAPSPTPDDTALMPAAWADAARGIELAETVPRSLAKGRAIDLHREEFSELGTFRGTMASLGCGLILAALVLVIAGAILGGVAKAIGWEFGERVAGAWPFVAIVVLGGFLALQVLPALVAGGRRHEEKS
jgi:myo-inositol 2-dehydrogenase/D-chiro-inositol 1-dehydrogenase